MHASNKKKCLRVDHKSQHWDLLQPPVISNRISLFNCNICLFLSQEKCPLFKWNQQVSVNKHQSWIIFNSRQNNRQSFQSLYPTNFSSNLEKRNHEILFDLISNNKTIKRNWRTRIKSKSMRTSRGENKLNERTWWEQQTEISVEFINVTNLIQRAIIMPKHKIEQLKKTTTVTMCTILLRQGNKKRNVLYQT